MRMLMFGNWHKKFLKIRSFISAQPYMPKFFLLFYSGLRVFAASSLALSLSLALVVLQILKYERYNYSSPLLVIKFFFQYNAVLPPHWSGGI